MQGRLGGVQKKTPGSSLAFARRGFGRGSYSQYTLPMPINQGIKFTSLIKSVSEQRLAPYYKDKDESPELALARYAWNITLCEALYPALNVVEVVLRNNLHAALMTLYGEEWYCLPHFLRDAEVRQIEDAKNEIVKEKKACTPGHILAGLSYGFCVTLLGRHYEQKIFHRLAQAILPNMPTTLRKRKHIASRLHKVRFSLRNRAFHHEPIWKNPSLLQNHDDMLETISWLNREAHD